MGIKLIKVGRLELPKIHELYVQIFKEYLDKYHDDVVNPSNISLEKLEEHHERFDGYHFIFHEKQLVGTIEIIHINWDSQDKIYLSNLGILPQYRNQGLAQALFQTLEKHYQPKDGWELWTLAQEAGNRHLYEKLGYQLTGKSKKVNDLMDVIEYTKK